MHHASMPVSIKPGTTPATGLARYPAIQTLLAFETAARLGSFTRAAQALFLTQTAVTYQVKALESYLDTRLFVRGGRGVTLTREGEAIYADITHGLEVIGRSLDGVRQYGRGKPASGRKGVK